MVTDERMVKRSTALFRLLPTDGERMAENVPPNLRKGTLHSLLLIIRIVMAVIIYISYTCR